MADNRPIGIFDSGVGGLSVAGEIIKALPKEKLIYFGDTARVPYGSKSTETVNKFACEIAEFLQSFNVKAIVIACNTVSSNSYQVLCEKFNIPFIEVVSPGVDACLQVTKNKKIGVIGTPATVASGAYEKMLKAADPEAQVYSKACPLFVPLVEECLTRGEITRLTVEMYLAQFKEWGIDSLILGCTHYPIMKDSIEHFMGEGVNIVNPAKQSAKHLRKYLEDNNMLSDLAENAIPEFYVSDLNQKKFGEVCRLAMGKAYEAKKISLENI